jgi:DNA-binding IclR family transcriptional regulator
MKTKYSAPTVKKAFNILHLLSKSENGLRISDLASRLAMGKSTVHGITTALEELGAIIRDTQTKRYTLGLTLFELGRAAYARTDLKDVARPAMENLMARTQESVYLGVRNGERITILDIVESWQDLKISSPVGASIPLFAGAAGKVLLAAMNSEEAAQLVQTKGLPRYTERTIVNSEQYLRELDAVRHQGFASDDEEFITGVRAVAAPIDVQDQLPSAIWVVGFKPSLDDAKMATLIEDIKKTAAEIRGRILQQAKG